MRPVVDPPQSTARAPLGVPHLAMKVLFIDEYLPQEMLGIMYVSRSIKDAGHDCKCLFIPDKDWLAKVQEYAPDVVCYSLTTGMHLYFADINRKVKAVLPNVISVFGGPHPTFVPEYVETDGVDAICRGEGELAIVELLNRLRDGQPYYDVKNFWFKDKQTGQIHKNEQRPLVEKLEDLGFPDRDVIYEAGAIYKNTDRKVFVTQRGCPMPCTFCFHHAMKKKVYGARNSEYVRKRSVSHVIDEINAVRKKYNLKFVHFVDDIFNLRNDWLEEFCERFPKEVGLPFDVILMANMTTEHHIELLKKAGCVYARVAFEAASDYVRNAVFKKHTTRQQLIDASGWIKKHGIRLGSLNMLGGPGGTMVDEFDTVKLNIECKVDHPLVSLMQPYPGDGLLDRRVRRLPREVQPHDFDPVREQGRDREPAQAVPDPGALPLAHAAGAQGGQAALAAEAVADHVHAVQRVDGGRAGEVVCARAGVERTEVLGIGRLRLPAWDQGCLARVYGVVREVLRSVLCSEAGAVGVADGG
jgi:radical SAM superfamily enzyme YgiQ (UPF0313 family)